MATKNTLQMHRVDGKNNFVEVVGSMLDKGKVVLTFVEYDDSTKKQKIRIDTYVETPRFLALCERILNGKLEAEIAEAKKTNMFEGQKLTSYSSFFTAMGGINESKAKARFADLNKMFPWLSEGDALSRQFKIQSGSKYPWIFRGEASVGKSDSRGLIVPQGSAKSYINIPMTNDSIVSLAAICKAFITAYYSQLFVSNSEALWPNQSVKVFTAEDYK